MSTATRSPSVSASTWSCVTYTIVEPSRWWSCFELGPHADAQLGVEVGERLVEEIDVGPAHERPGEGDALPLAAGELVRVPLEEMRAADELGCPLHSPRLRLLRHPAGGQAEGDVLLDREVGKERVALEDHRDVALAGRHLRHVAPADRDRPLA